MNDMVSIELLQYELEHGIVTLHLERLLGRVDDKIICSLVDLVDVYNTLRIICRACSWVWKMTPRSGADTSLTGVLDRIRQIVGRMRRGTNSGGGAGKGGSRCA